MRRRWCGVCKTMNGHAMGCPEDVDEEYETGRKDEEPDPDIDHDEREPTPRDLNKDAWDHLDMVAKKKGYL